MLGGLAFFLYGMSVMGEGLEKQSGSSLTALLSKMTSNPVKGVLLGAAVTAVIQSSSATTVMVVGFVNSGIMQLRQALSVIMGANVGTTITAWFLSLVGIQSDNFFINLLKPASFSPIIALIGIFLYMFAKGGNKKDIGSICLGFALLMFGMGIMSDAVSPLADIPEFGQLLLLFSNPILGLLMGVLMTAILQSSSASVGILQALTNSGMVTYAVAMPIILGQNIGTCVTAMLSSIGTSKNAKRAALGHLYFNVVGAVVFMGVFYGLNALLHFSFLNETMNPLDIAVIHSLFNVSCTIILLPFTKQLEKLVCMTIKDEPQAVAISNEPELLDERLLLTPGLALDQADKRTLDMGLMSNQNLRLSFELMQKYDHEKAQIIEDNEDRIDNLEDKLGGYLIKLSGRSLSQKDSRRTSKILHTISDFERIGDHTCNLLNSATELHDKRISFSDVATRDLQVLRGAVEEILDLTLKGFETEDLRYAVQVEPLEEVIDYLCDELKNRHITRMQKGLCSMEKGFIYLDVLTNLERISDHCSNVAVCLIELDHDSFDTHEYLNNLKTSGELEYTKLHKAFLDKYRLV
jgi:phosphate:Na+ symporter